MANPRIVTCARDTWTKINTTALAAGSTATIFLLTKPQYLVDGTSALDYFYTYRDGGTAAPTDAASEDNDVRIDFVSGRLQVTFRATADIYIYAVGGAGKVRLDT